MKYVLVTLAVVALFAGQALASDGNLSQDMLSKMGLSSMNVMSDTQGTAVRGMGFAQVWGASFAQVGATNDLHGYFAVATGPGADVAAGGTVSNAAVIVPPFIFSTFATGVSFAATSR